MWAKKCQLSDDQFLECFELETAYDGNDLHSVTDVATVAQCQQICQDTAGCTHYSWHLTNEYSLYNGSLLSVQLNC